MKTQGTLLCDVFYDNVVPKEYTHQRNSECTAYSPPGLALHLSPSVYQEVDPHGLCHLGSITSWLPVGLANEQPREGKRRWVLPCFSTVSLAVAVSFHDDGSLLVTPSPQLWLSLDPLSLLVSGVTASYSS